MLYFLNAIVQILKCYETVKSSRVHTKCIPHLILFHIHETLVVFSTTARNSSAAVSTLSKFALDFRHSDQEQLLVTTLQVTFNRQSAF